MKINNNYNLMPVNNRPTFKRNWAEHASWGARFVKETGKTNFKLFTFPDVKKVFVEIAQNVSNNFGNIKCRTAKLLYVPGATMLTVDSISPADSETNIYEMNNKGEGVFEVKDIPSKDGAQYRYIIVKDPKDVRYVKDPYSMKQPHINGWSEIYDSNKYEWKNTDWLEGKDPRRIVRKPNEKFRGLENLVIEEINIPTLSNEGTIEKAYAYIDKIVAKGIANAIEIMPVENTYSLQWGYDGVDKFAVNSNMGTPDELKGLIDYAHGKGLNVIMDVVPNHIGPDGNYLSQTGPYIGEVGEFGDIPNFEKENNKFVRDWVANASLWWATEFKVDGLRLDMTQKCNSDLSLRQITAEVHEHAPEVFIIAEDGRNNWGNVTTYNRFATTHEEELNNIDIDVDRITRKVWSSSPQELGFDSEWDFPLMHALYDSIVYPYKIDLDKLDYLIKNSQHRVKYIMSHDEIGNVDGTRLLPKVFASELYLFGRVKGFSDPEKGQNAANLSQKLVELYVSKNIKKMTAEEINAYARENGMQENQTISVNDIERAFNIAKAKQKVHLGSIFTIPGPKMYFQGNDELELARFKFFRELSGDKYDRANKPYFVADKIRKKGYDEFEPIARPDSIIGKIPQEDSLIRKEFKAFTNDLAEIVKDSNALTKGEIIRSYKDIHHKVHTHLLKFGEEEVLVIKNFGDKFHNNSYGFEWFPEGQWKEIFNSDKAIYGGMGYVNEQRSDISWKNQNLNMSPNSIMILKKL